MPGGEAKDNGLNGYDEGLQGDRRGGLQGDRRGMAITDEEEEEVRSALVVDKEGSVAGMRRSSTC